MNSNRLLPPDASRPASPAHRAHPLRHLALAGLLFALLVGAARAQFSPLPPTVRAIRVLGLDAAGERAVRGALPLAPGALLDPAALAMMRARLAGSGIPLSLLRVVLEGADEADPTGGGPVTLVLDFRPPARVAGVAFFPLIAMETAPLREACPLRVGEELTPARLEAAAAAVSAAARGASGRDCTVALHRLATTTGTATIGFIIAPTTGTATLRDLHFGGAGWGNAGALRGTFRHLEPNPIDTGTTLTAELLAQAEEITTRLMQSQGYLNARARLDATEPTRKGVRVTYAIERGPRFSLGDIRATGDIHPDPAFWEPVIERFADGKLTSERLRDLDKAIRGQAATEGYMAAEPHLDFRTDPATHVVDVTARVDEGTTSALAAVTIETLPPEHPRGDSWYHRAIAPPVAEAIVRRQIRAKIGDPLNRQLTEDAERRLWGLGTFDKVEVETEPTSFALVRRLRVRLRERRTAAFGSSIGWSPEIGPIGRLTFSEANVGGRADAISLGISANRAGLGFDAAYFDRYWSRGERWFGRDREPSLLYAAYLRARDYDDQYTERRAGGRLTLGMLAGSQPGPWSEAWTARLERVG